MVQRRQRERSLFEVLLPDGHKLWPEWLRRIDTVLEDESVIEVVAQALEARWPQSRRRGRPARRRHQDGRLGCIGGKAWNLLRAARVLERPRAAPRLALMPDRPTTRGGRSSVLSGARHAALQCRDACLDRRMGREERHDARPFGDAERLQRFRQLARVRGGQTAQRVDHRSR